MKRKIDEWTIEHIYGIRDTISFPEYQREARLWRNDDKALLIDSILKDIDIPSIYLYTANGEFDVIDGQQRLWAIWGYLDGEFACPVGGAKLFFDDLKDPDKNKIRDYKMHVTLLSDVSDDYLRALFVRLQLGLLLNTGEKLHSMTGAMKEFLFDEFINQPFIEKVRIPNRRYAKETLGAQICINVIMNSKVGQYSRTRYEDLRALFLEYAQPKGQAKALLSKEKLGILETCDTLDKSFGSDTNKLRSRSMILSVFLYASNPATKPKSMKQFARFILELIERLKQESQLGFDRKNAELYALESYLSTAPTEKYQIDRRHQKIDELYRHYLDHGTIMGD